MNKSSFLYWYPKIKNLNIPQPKTKILDLGAKALNAFQFDNNLKKRLKEKKIRKIIFKIKQAAQKMGYPIFLRTDHCSAKHEFENTCFVKNEENLLGNLVRLIEEDSCIGFLSFQSKAIIIREFLELEYEFKAFRGELPIAKERRYFIKDGKVKEHFHYWPVKAFEIYHKPTKENWEELLEKINFQSSEEINILSRYAEKAGEVLEGYWSVDFAKGIDGNWYLIDMAEGEKSFNLRKKGF